MRLIAAAFVAGSSAMFIGVSAASAYTGQDMANLAAANLGLGPCSTNSLGGTGFESSCYGSNGSPELWCADFAKWVWYNSGVADTGDLTSAAGSFYLYGQKYGTLSSTPAVGDAVVFNYSGNGYADHVALVTQVSGTSIVSIGGDEGPGAPTSSKVLQDGPYSDALGYSSYWAMNISGYIAPVGVPANPPTYEVAFSGYGSQTLWGVGSGGWSNWAGDGLATGTSPSITAMPNSSYLMAYQGSSGHLFTQGPTGTPTDWNVGMAPGTNPSIAALSGGGYEIAFQASGGGLWTVGTAGWSNWGYGLAPGTSPSIAALSNGSYIVAFQGAGNNQLWTATPDNTIGSKEWSLGMAAGTNPSVAGLPNNGYQIAFQANGGHLWSVGTAGWTDTGYGMAPGTSPSIAALSSGGTEVAYQGYGNDDLWLWGSVATTQTTLGMTPGTSPSIAGKPNNGYEVAISGSGGTVWTMGSLGWTNWGAGLATGTNPSIE